MFVEDVMVAANDIDALRQQLHQAQRLSSIGAIASSVAHELNNILMVIYNQAKLALRSRASDEDRVEALEKILRSGDRAGAIVRSMLGIARNTSESSELTDVVSLVEEVLLLAEKDLNRHRVTVEKRYHGRPRTSMIASQIEQVVLNLILNARQAMPRGGILTIEAREDRPQGMVEIKIADTGCGIAPEQLRQIFEPFYTTKDPDEQGNGGTGLGLSICREIIEHHQGRIRVESLVDKGTCFTIKLPLPSSESSGE